MITNETPPRACLADFGLSTLTPGTPGDATTITTGGTPLYMAPELLCPTKFGKTNARPTQPADIYALGMVIYEVLTGFQPFHEQNYGIFELTYQVVNGARPVKPDNAVEIGLGGKMWELVEECWSQEPTKRPTIGQILTHLTRVAASSEVVDPTPEKPRETTDSREFGCSSKRFILSARDNSHLGAQGQIRLFGPITTTAQLRTVIPVNQVATVNTVSPVSTTSMASTISTLASGAASSMTSVPSRNSEDSHRSGRHFLTLVYHASQPTFDDHSQMAILGSEEVFVQEFDQDVTHSTVDISHEIFGWTWRSTEFNCPHSHILRKEDAKTRPIAVA